jgi:predicted SprT family Zn-dependent metalloprotease
MKQLCLAEIERAFLAAEAHYGRSIDRVPVTFSNRLTHTAGKAFTKKGKGLEIRLSAKLLASEGDAFVKRTPGHEAAHIISIELFGTEGRGHGARWKEVMKVIGIEAKRCHSYTVPKRKTFTYCPVRGVVKELTLVRHNKLQRGVVRSYTWKDGYEVFKEDWIQK